MIHFEYPQVLLFILIPVLWLVISSFLHKRNNRKQRIWNPLEAQHTSDEKKNILLTKRDLSMFLGLVFCIIALANPRKGSGLEETKVERSDVYIALDISHSMNATDVPPSRLERAKKWAEEFILSEKGNRIGLVFFAGNAYLQMPLSSDYASALMYIKSAQTDMAPAQGSSIADALNLIHSLHQEESKSQKAVVIISDGEEHENEAVSAVKNLSDKGWVTFAMGVGTTSGSEIPVLTEDGEDLAREEDGSLAISKLNVEVLKNIAQAGGGNVFLMNDGKKAIKEIKNKLLTLRQEMSEVKSYREFTHYYPIFIVLSILCFFHTFQMIPIFTKRKLSLIILLLLSMGLNAQSAHQNLQNGDELYKQGRFEEAAQQYHHATEKNPSFSAWYNLGNSLYQLKLYKEAQKAYQNALEFAKTEEQKFRTHHNAGNASYQQQQFQESVNAYKKALQNSPNDKETIENLLKARKKVKEQQQKEQNKKQQDQKQKDNQESQQQKDNQDQNQQNKQENNSQKPEQDKNAPLTKEEAEKLMEIIENEDKKVHKKIRRGSTRPAQNGKPW